VVGDLKKEYGEQHVWVPTTKLLENITDLHILLLLVELLTLL
jgi:hypothetical protein